MPTPQNKHAATPEAQAAFIKFKVANIPFPKHLRQHLAPAQSDYLTARETKANRDAINANGHKPDWELVRFSTKKAKAIKWLWPGYLAEGKLTTLSGEPGHGKSLVTLDIAARVTTGKDWPDGSKNPMPPSDVLLLTVEEDSDDTILPRFQVAGGDPSKLVTLSIGGHDGLIKIDHDLDKLTALLREGGQYKLIILDPVLDFTKAKQNMDEEVRAALNKLVQMARDLRVAVLGVNHLNKKTDLAAAHRVAGARAWTSVARLNFLLGKGDDSALRHVCPLKMNLAPDDGGSLDYTIEAERLDIDSHPTKQPRVIWKGKGSATVDCITKAQQPRPDGPPETEWIRDCLQPVGEWKPLKEIIYAASLDGIGERRLRRLTEKMPDIEKRLVGMPARGEWRLVAATKNGGGA